MPWKQQGGGGGPWGGGGGGQGPWGRGPGGPQSPDLEELLRKGQDSFRKMMPSGFGGGKGILLLVAAAVVIWLASGLYRVQPDEQGVVLRFGKFVKTTQPGLNYHLPTPIESALTPKVTRINRIEIGFRSAPDAAPSLIPGRVTQGARNLPDESLMLTGDENIVDINFTVFWRISDAGAYLFNIRNPEQTVRIAAEAALREVIGQTPIQSALTEGRNQVEVATRDQLQRLLNDYGAGIAVQRVQLLKVDPPQPVIDAFIDVQRARADLERLRNEAEAYRNDIIPRARGEAERVIQEARAYKEQIVAKSEGEAQRFVQVYEAYAVAKEVTTQRIYLETVEEVMRGMQKVIIDGNGMGHQGVVPYLPLPELRRHATEPRQQEAAQ